MAVEHKGFLELYNLANKTVVSKLPLSHLKFLPRVGERVLISPTGLADRESYKVVAIEYFLNYDPTQGVIRGRKNHALRRTSEPIKPIFFKLTDYRGRVRYGDEL